MNGDDGSMHARNAGGIVSDVVDSDIPSFDPRADLGVWLERAKRRSERHAVVLIGGHVGGEFTIASGAQALNAVLRHGDQIWLWRGECDRIVLLLTGVGDLPTAATVVRRLMSQIGQPGAYAGVALLQPGEGVDSLMRRVEGAWLLATDEDEGHVATSPVLGRANRG